MEVLSSVDDLQEIISMLSGRQGGSAKVTARQAT